MKFMKLIMSENYNSDNILKNILLMNKNEFGESKKWKGIIKKLERQHSLNKD